MFWMKWICREVRGAAPACPTTSAMFWESEEDTAADRAGPEGTHGATREQNLPNPVLFSLESGPALLVCAESGCDGLVRLLRLQDIFTDFLFVISK